MAEAQVRGPHWLERSARVSGLMLLLLAGIALAGFVGAKLALVVVPTLIAILFSAVLRPPARLLERARFPKSLAAFLALLSVILVMGGVAWWIVPAIVQEVSTVGDQVAQQARDLVHRAVQKTPLSWEHLARLEEAARQRVTQSGGKIAMGVVVGAWTFFEMVVGLLLTLVLIFFFVRDGERMKRWILERLAGVRHDEVGKSLDAGVATLRKYLAGMGVIATVDAIGIGLGLWIIGVPLVLPLTALVFFSAFFPIIGAVSAGMVACVVALATGGVTDALLALAVVVGVQQLESNLLEPLVLGRALPLHPVAVILALSAGAIVAGIAGAFLAVPLTAFVVAALETARRESRKGAGEPSTGSG